ncbi:MAG: leucine-rich repeat protein [Paludibacteraceae bacterium]|nr:leucine-rich repeat protein [Paludibacteraceae bacterium]
MTLANIGDKVYVRGDNPDGFSHDNSSNDANGPGTTNSRFKMSGRIAASGSVMSLIDGVGTSTKIPCAYCFSDLFRDCVSLTKAPELPATELAPNCYALMFQKCTNLTNAPELPATELAARCYISMFLNCSSLTDVPALLPATKMETGSCWGMFAYCSKLIKSPELLATELAPRCYNSMFIGCESLAEAPKLVATELADSCYFKMFSGCTSLVKAPELPADSWKKGCYSEMFSGCTSLNYIKVNVLTLDNDLDATKKWVDGIDGEGVFIFLCGSKYDKHGASEVPTNFTIVSSPIVVFQNPDSTEIYRDTIGCDVMPVYRGIEPPYWRDDYEFVDWDKEVTRHSVPGVYYYTGIFKEIEKKTPSLDKVLCFTAVKDGSSVLYNNFGNNYPDVEYTLDSGITWHYLRRGEAVVLKNKGDKMYLRGDNPDGFSFSESQYSVFNLGWIAASGSVMSLIDQKGEATEIPNDYCFYRLFSLQDGIVQAPELTATKLKKHCYASMFYGCSNLQKGPEIIPATTLAESCCADMFCMCENLQEVPQLPATTLAESCYAGMFYMCDKLENAPELPAVVMEKSCYNRMFGACENLLQAPKLPATILAESCYQGMFYSCYKLEKAPELPATELAPSCYKDMFVMCSSLENIPELPAIELAPSCYESMFYGCGSIEQTPTLPATTLASRCYAYMFFRTLLNGIPTLPATELSEYCYAGMFKEGGSIKHGNVELPATVLVEGCYEEMFTKVFVLDSIKVGVMSLDNQFNATTNWVDGIDYEGVFVFPCGSKYDKHGVSEVPENFTIISSPIVVFQNPDGEELYRDTIGCNELPEYKGETPTYGEGQVFKGWEPELTAHDTPDTYYYMAVYDETTPEVGNWLCFTADEANSVVQYLNVGSNNPNVMYSIDGGKTWEALQESVEVKLEKIGDKVYLKGNNPTGFSQGKIDYTHIKTTGRVFVSGSVMSLIDEEGVSTEIPNDYCFYHLFADSPALIKAPELPATELKKSCYEGMFQECTSLESVPVLPATTLADRCYKNMFLSCYMIKETPELPATTLAKECYSHMFSSCKEVKKAPLLPATVMADSCYSGMFLGCYGLSVAPTLPAVHLAKGCYNGMFEGCWNLEEAPALPATELAVSCYEEMFKGCGSLTKAPVLPATVMKDYCYASMFSDCISLLEAPELPATILADACYEEMFIGCEKLTEAPELPATSLVRECYMDMFASCINITYIKVGVLSLDNSFDATTNWVAGIDGFGVFVFPCGSKYDKHGRSEVPDNFTIISSPVVVFQNPDGEELYRDTIGCDVLPVYRGETPTYKEGLVFKGWDPELTIHSEPDTFYYTAVYEEGQTSITDVSKCLCFTAEKANSYVYYQNHGGNSPDVQYSIDEGRTWQSWGENEVLILKNVGEKIYVRGTNPDGFSHMANLQKSDGEEVGQFTNFKMSGEIAASGSVMSLIDGKGESLVIPCDYCFAHLFNSTRNPQQHEDVMTTALTKAPELPATTLTMGCYLDMFGTCSLLKEAPVLPATELASSCYVSMFNNCRSLEIAPALPATKLSKYCYEGMFSNSGIVVAPELPATDLMDSCYWGMFRLCKNMESAPELLATELKPGCYEGMFAGCSNLNYIKVGVMTLDNDFAATNEWVTGVNGPGTFIFPCGSKYDKHGVSEVPVNFKIISSPVVIFQNPDGEELYRDTIGCDVLPEYRGETPTYGEGLVFKGWDPELTIHPEPDTFYYTAVYEEQMPITDVSKCLCFTAEEAGTGIWYETWSEDNPNLQYSVDEGRTWQTQRLSVNEKVVLENVGDKIYFRGFNPDGLSGHLRIKTDGTIKASGSVMSLIDGIGVTKTIPNKGCFAGLFSSCNGLIQAPELPATTLADSCYSSMFLLCDKLTVAPELPATELANECYSYMFDACDKLTEAPKLPAMELTDNCYSYMFRECTSLTKAPELPATKLADACYSYMFQKCTNLIQAPELPATVMKSFCYDGMFYGCESLTVAPELPATELAYVCYINMFYECTNLIQAPELPATELKSGCYYSMFEKCKSLEKAPELPATELVGRCYNNMFRECSNLNYIKVGVMSLDTSTNNWVNGVNKEGVFIFPCGSKYDKHGVSEVPEKFKIISSPVVVFQNPDGEELYRDTIGCDVLPEYRGETPTYGEGLVFKGWDPELTIHPEPDTFYYTAVYEEGQATITDVSKCLCFTAEEAGSEVWYVNEMDNAPDVQYSVDGGRTWNVLAPEEHVVLTSVGDKVYLRGNNPSGFSHERDRSALDLIMPGIYTHFGMTGSIAASGSVMSLIDEVGETTEIPNENCFYKLFEECSSLIQAPELSATTLKESCYESMFSQCSSLTQAPALPATKMADRCYLSMFASCSNLTEAPQLPATELAPSCYSSMFYSCESLVAAPELPATQLANACYASMFSGCTSLTETPKLIATTLSDECYRWMFRGCTGLTKAPELPATTLAHSCYAGMFSKCSSLTDAPELPATTLAEYCYGNMFNGCSNLTTAPELPATELVNECYNGMFGECHSLNYIKVGVMSLDNNFEYGATRDWVSGVDGPGVFIFPCGSTYDKHGVSEVPDDFEIMRGAVIVIFQNPDSTVLWKDTINCNEVPEYKGETPTMGEDYFFIGWDKELTAVGDESVYYITAVYEDLNKYKSLHLTVDDTLYLVLPGGSETIGYELLEGGGSRYEIWYEGVMITEGAVTNDSTVQLICPEDFTPGAYAATLVMYDGRNGRASSDFEFNVMLPDNKENSYYVKVWNDVVICRNGDGIFQSYMWYKDRKKQENSSYQYYNDKTLLNGEYMVYVCDVYGKCYFIEPTSFQIEEAIYSVSAHPNIVDRGTDFIISVSGVDESHLKDARIVIYRSDGVVARIIDDVEMENEMHLGLGEYVIVLTVNDGKNANCKVLVK